MASHRFNRGTALILAGASLALIPHGALRAGSKLLSEDPHFRYELKFTNPVCGPHAISPPAQTIDKTGTRAEKPKDVYCSGLTDVGTSTAPRPDGSLSVQEQAIAWVKDPATKDIFFAALSFSNSSFYKAVCKAASQGVSVTYVLDAPGGPGGKQLEHDPDCLFTDPQTGEKRRMVTFIERGHTDGDPAKWGSGDAINWAHNKILLINPRQNGSAVLRAAFGSGNFSSGMLTHHENWHFIQASRASYFMQSHLCLMKGLMADNDSGTDPLTGAPWSQLWKQLPASLQEPIGQVATSRNGYAEFIRRCQKLAELGGAQPEADIIPFFSPGRGQAATEEIEKRVQDSGYVRIGAHRFTYSRLMKALHKLLKTKPAAEIRLVADDDLFWLTVPEELGGGEFGDNSMDEANKVQALLDAGQGRFRVKYMETNTTNHQLHHAKFLVFDRTDKLPPSVFTGAGNLTGDAFDNNPPSGNFENFYLIFIPQVVQAFREHYDQMFDGKPSTLDHGWQGRATPGEKMPVGNPLPVGG
jgi:hypothetical protein